MYWPPTAYMIQKLISQVLAVCKTVKRKLPHSASSQIADGAVSARRIAVTLPPVVSTTRPRHFSEEADSFISRGCKLKLNFTSSISVPAMKLFMRPTFSRLYTLPCSPPSGIFTRSCSFL